MERCLAASVIGEKQIKTIIRCHSIHISMLELKGLIMPNAGEIRDNLNSHIYCWKECKMTQLLGNH